MTSNPDEIRAEIEQTRANLSQHVDDLAEQANPARMAERQVGKVKAAGSRLVDNIMGAAEDAKDATAQGLQQLGDGASGQANDVGQAIANAPAGVRRQTVGNPIAAGLVAFGIGLLVAAAIPSSRKEQELAETVKEKAEPFTDQVVSAAKEVASNLSEPASEAVDSLKATATEAANHVRSEGEGAIADVKEATTDSVDEVTQTARSAAEDGKRAISDDQRS